MTDLDELVDRSDPARGYTDRTENLVALMAASAASEASVVQARKPWWRVPRIVVPMVALGAAIVTTAGALLVPLTLVIDGVEVEPEVIIPIHYVTGTGVVVDCAYGIDVGAPASRTAAEQALADYLHSQDWSGVGQEIYERAMANPFVPGPDDEGEFDNQEIMDHISFTSALGVIYERIPAGMMTEGVSAGGTMTCTGQLR